MQSLLSLSKLDLEGVICLISEPCPFLFSSIWLLISFAQQEHRAPLNNRVVHHNNGDDDDDVDGLDCDDDNYDET